MKAIIMDVDQVLLDYSGRLREWYNAKYGKSVEGHSKTWDLREWLGIDDDMFADARVRDIISEFATTWEFGTLDAFPGADVVLHELMRDHKLICLTACGTDEVTQSLRKVNLFHRFGDIFEDVYFVNPTDSKTEVLKKLNMEYNVVAFIDDKPQNIIDATMDAGIKNPILMKAPHNREFRKMASSIPAAFGWYECKTIIRSL